MVPLGKHQRPGLRGTRRGGRRAAVERDSGAARDVFLLGARGVLPSLNPRGLLSFEKAAALDAAGHAACAGQDAEEFAPPLSHTRAMVRQHQQQRRSCS